MKAGTFFAVANPIFGEIKESQKKNTPYVGVELTIEGGPCAGEAIEWCGWLSEKARPNTVKALVECFGWKGDLNELACASSSDGRCMVVVSEEKGTSGKTFYKADYINPIGVGPMDGSKKQSIIDGLRAQCLADAKGVTPPAPSAERPTSAPAANGVVPNEEDEIPF